MRQVEITGRTVEEAVGRAAGELGVERDDVDVEVVDPGARGMLGDGSGGLDRPVAEIEDAE